MVRVTGNFASESPLHPAAREALLAAFDQGWADPKKLSQSSAKAAILRNQALENIASRLGVSADSIEVLGEPSLGHFLSIAGLFRDGSPFAYSAIDKGKVRAIARSHHSEVLELPVGQHGEIQGLESVKPNSILSFQAANGETGIMQSDALDIDSSVLVSVDATASGPRLKLPHFWSTALFDSLSWNGPSGLAIMAIKDRSRFAYPLPRIAPISSPGSYSLPLLIASSIALENFIPEESKMRVTAVDLFSSLENVEVIGTLTPALPHLFSIIAGGVSGESVVRELAQLGIDVDSGSACSPEDLQPSHVIAAMCYQTTGHLRFTLHQGVTVGEIEELVNKVSAVLTRLRS